MKEFIIEKKHNNKRLDTVLLEVFPCLSKNTLYKAFRKKDIRVNQSRVKENFIVSQNDKVQVYIIDELLNPSKNVYSQALDIVYEDENILIVNKPQGIPVHPDKTQKENTLIDIINTYLKQNIPNSNHKLPVACLCHRLDRNTGGLLLVAKNKITLETIQEKMSTNEIKKSYICLVKGKMKKNSDTLKDFLIKDTNKNRVFISEKASKDSLTILTKYEVESIFENLNITYTNNNVSHRVSNITKLHIDLLTGRTHQIRAHLAHKGNPVIGDGKYGINALNRQLGTNWQALWAYKITFNFKTTNYLSYLNNKSFTVEHNLKTAKKEPLIDKILSFKE